MKKNICAVGLLLLVAIPALADHAEDICRPKWRDDHKMLEGCIKEQLSAKEAVDNWHDNGGDIELINRCEEKWTNEDLAINYSMVKYCISQLSWAVKRLQNTGD